MTAIDRARALSEVSEIIGEHKYLGGPEVEWNHMIIFQHDGSVWRTDRVRKDAASAPAWVRVKCGPVY